ncbi:hypothetical protein [Lysinibacillus sp. SGAir0095]|uniref:hypothetical protein n=1 Tax=Lysinibacillus sp. SGAir0095 TaxID=2070463 RepID=UPI0010CD05FA|nr:hypothetical protein [Lysinibacillus sp. SGAir0095]QCR33110.1 hypothetical protein C1N55_13380 [Lysinibacillus sp. SGAir0095]
MYKYKVTIQTPNRDVIEFESKYHISMIHPTLIVDGAYPIFFKDAEVMINLAQNPQIEIDGQVYQYNLIFR